MAIKKRGLGRGLDALITAVPHTQVPSEISLELIIANKNQPRKYFDQAAIEELAASISQHGVITPIIVRQLDNGRYELVAGERRVKASRLAGKQTIPAVIKSYTDSEINEIALIENIQRRDLTPIEEAHAYEALKKEHGLTQDQLAERVGRSRSYIANYLRLLDLPQVALDALEDGSLTVGAARPLLMIDDPALRLKTAHRLIDGSYSARGAEALCENIRRAEKKQSAEKGSAEKNSPSALSDAAEILYLKETEDKLKMFFGLNTKLHLGKKRGRIEITFNTTEELERLVSSLTERHDNDVERKKEMLRQASKKFTI